MNIIGLSILVASPGISLAGECVRKAVFPNEL